MLKYEKRSLESNFSFTFDRQKKIDGNMAVFPKKSENYTNAIILSIFSDGQK